MPLIPRIFAPQFVYKHTELQWGRKLVEMGGIRLGSFKYYRNIEVHSDGVGDSGEGTYEEESCYSFESGKGTIPDVPRGVFSKELEESLPRVPGVRIKNLRYWGKHESPNRLLMWCLSFCSSPEVGRAINPLNECVVEIPLTDEHIGAVTAAAASTLAGTRPLRADRCVYKPRRLRNPTHFEREHQVFRKPKRYEPQGEYRVVMVTSGEAPDTLDLNVPRLIGCRLIPYPT